MEVEKHGLVLKFFDKHHPDWGVQLQSAKFHLTPLRVFHDKEVEDSSGDINDQFEGVVIVKNSNYGNSGDKTRMYKYLGKTHTAMKDVVICCFSYLSEEEDFVQIHDGLWKINPMVLDELERSFGDRSVIVWEESDFVKVLKGLRITNKENITDARYRLVEYSDGVVGDSSIIEINNDKTLNYFLDKVVFNKQKRFSTQREFRLACLSPNGMDAARTMQSSYQGNGIIHHNFSFLRRIRIKRV